MMPDRWDDGCQDAGAEFHRPAVELAAERLEEELLV